MNVIIRIRNFKKIRELTKEFKAGYLYLVKGGNNVGKTSFWQAILSVIRAENKNPNILTFGQKDGSVELEINKETSVIGGDGETYIGKLTYSDEKEDKFSMILPDATLKKKVTEIRNIFKYNAFTVEDWFAWGLTEEGRRKQGQIIFEMFPEEIQKAINDIDKKINPKDGSLYFQRQGKNEIYQGLKNAPPEILTSEEQEKAALKAQVLEELEPLEKNFKIMEEMATSGGETIELKAKLNAKIKAGEDAIEDSLRQSQLRLKEIDEEIERLKQKRAKVVDDHINTDESLKKEIAEAKKDLAKLPNTEFDKEGYESLKKRVNKGREFLQDIQKIDEKAERILNHTKKVEIAQKEWEVMDNEIKRLQLAKKELFSSSEVGIPNITLENGELFFVEGENKIPFTEQSLSYSVGGKKVIRILLERNKELPIICVGKAAEYDEKSLDEIAELAKEYNAIIFADQVEQLPVPLHIDVVESKSKSNKKPIL